MVDSTEPAFVLRTDATGRVTALNLCAQNTVGHHAVGTACDQVVRATAPGGGPVCRAGCAAELVSGATDCAGGRQALLRGKRVSLRCYRVGNEAVVIADPVQSAPAQQRLTERECEVLALVAKGLSSPAIAAELGIRASTVRCHVERARERLGTKTRAEAVARAIATGQLSLND